MVNGDHAASENLWGTGILDTTSFSPKMQEWENDFRSLGRVEIKFINRKMTPRIAFSAVLLATLVLGLYNDGLYGEVGLVIGVLAAATFLIGLVAWVRSKWSGKAIVVEQDSIVTMEDIRIPWTDLDHVTVFHVPRSGAAVQLVLTEEAWDSFMASQGRGGRILHGSNKVMSANRGLIMPQYLDAKPEEISLWLNYRLAERLGTQLT